MTDQVTPRQGASTRIRVGGIAQAALYGPLLGGFLVNPTTAEDQGLSVAEPLFVDLTGPATLGDSPTTVTLWPGDEAVIPPGDTIAVWVNAASTGHRFACVLLQPATPFPPVPPPGPFPPVAPTSLSRVIPSYLYEQYADDEDLQAFVAAYNAMAQQYLDWFNQVGLPVYTGPLITGSLLDWVAEGLYGMMRPALSSGRNRNLGPFNTYTLNGLAFNAHRVVGPSDVVATSDDVFKRILTWHLFKGDGKVFNIRWLKRRVMRFLQGTNGVNVNVDNTYQVSVTFGVGNQVNISLGGGIRTVLGGALFNRFALNTTPFNQLRTSFQSSAPLANAAILKEAIESGALELPFQFDYVVNIQ